MCTVFLASAMWMLLAGQAYGIDEFKLDRLFGIPESPEIETITFNLDDYSPGNAFDSNGMRRYRVKVEGWGIYARKFGELRREEEQSGFTVPVRDILDPEYGMIGAFLTEFKFGNGHILDLNGFRTAFEETRDPLTGTSFSARYSYRLIEDRDGFLALEAGYSYFKSHAEFTFAFYPSAGPIVQERNVHNPLIGINARIRVSELSALEFGVRANPMPLDWINTNTLRADARWEFIFAKFAGASIGYQLFRIRFQEPANNESADLTLHGPYVALGMFF